MHNQNPQQSHTKLALFNLGFRPFFLCAGLFSVMAMALWTAIYLFQFQLPPSAITSMQWHAHEMLYGYGLAVIAGFLLTAVKNWTGVQTLYGLPLFLLVAVWAIARVLLALGYVFSAGIFDLLFIFSLCCAVSYPIIKVKQWRQLAVLSKLIFLLVCNTLFYLDALNIIAINGINWGIYGGLYLIVGLILMIARRVLPFFISAGLGENITVFNSKWLDLSSLLLFLAFFISEMFLQHLALSAYLALALFAVNGCRLIGWHHKGIWQKPMLWSLYLSLWSISVGFLLFAGSYFGNISTFIAIHAFAYGGIGAITLAMMARVSLGHTGRNIHQPPAIMALAFGLMLIGTLSRVALPLLLPQHYITWIGLSQALWISAFLIFCVVYLPLLSTARIDGKQG